MADNQSRDFQRNFWLDDFMLIALIGVFLQHINQLFIYLIALLDNICENYVAIRNKFAVRYTPSLLDHLNTFKYSLVKFLIFLDFSLTLKALMSL